MEVNYFTIEQNCCDVVSNKTWYGEAK